MRVSYYCTQTDALGVRWVLQREERIFFRKKCEGLAEKTNVMPSKHAREARSFCARNLAYDTFENGTIHVVDFFFQQQCNRPIAKKIHVD